MQRKAHSCNFYQQQKCTSIVLVFIVGFLNLLEASGDDYLKEAPSFLTPCTLSDPNNGVCIAKAVENVFTNWKDGIPGLKNLGSIDPFHVKKIHFVQDNQNIDLKLDLKDVVITGLSKTKVIKASVKNEYNFKVLVKIPLLHCKGDYRIKGSLLLLNLDGAGSMESKISEVEVTLSLKAKLIIVNNQRFFDITSAQSNVKNIGNLNIHFGNLYNGSAELSESANTVFNQNWRQIFEIIRPAVEETLDAITFDRYKKIFSYVPANYFIEDLP